MDSIGANESDGPYDKPIRWFLSLEEGGLDGQSEQSGKAAATPRPASPDAAERAYRKTSEAPATYRPMI